jgi:transcriptional regulator with PAS, ATPase and Fis domain
VLGPGAVGARTIKGSVTTEITVIGGIRDRLADAIFDPSRLYDVLRLDRFTGRAELIDQIDSYIDRHRSGYVLIRGEAGVGKSTLAAF